MDDQNRLRRVPSSNGVHSSQMRRYPRIEVRIARPSRFVKRQNFERKLTGMQKDILQKLENPESILTENEVNYIKSSLNNSFSGSGSDNSFGRKLNDMIWNNEDHFRLTPEQNEKGFEFLKKYAKKEGWHENAYRENYVLENFKEFRLEGYKDDANYVQSQHGMHNYVPIYLAIAKDGSTFEYYYNAGKVNITG